MADSKGLPPARNPNAPLPVLLPLALLVLPVALQEPDTDPVTLGATVRGVVAEEDSALDSPILAARRIPDVAPRVATHALVLDEDAGVRLTLTSHTFPCQLVLREAGGALVEERRTVDTPRATLTRDLAAGAYEVQVVSYLGLRGAYELSAEDSAEEPAERDAIGAARAARFELDEPVASAYATYLLACLQAADEAGSETAVDLFTEALGVFEATLGEHPLVVWCLHARAKVHGDGRRDDAALADLERARALSAKVYGELHLEHADLLASFGNFLRRRDRYEEARELYTEELAVREQLQPATHPDIGSTVNVLAICYESLGDVDAAVALYRRAIEIREAEHGPEGDGVIQVVTNLAICYSSAQRFQESMEVYERVLALRELHPGEGSLKLADELFDASRVLTRLQDYERARELAQRALDLHEAHYGVDVDQNVSGMSQLGHTLFYLGRHEEELELRRRIVAVRAPDGEAGTRNAAYAYRYLGECLAALGRDEEALEAYEAYGRYYAETGGADHVRALTFLAEQLQRVGETGRALEKAAEIHETLRAADSMEPEKRSDVGMQLADLYAELGERARAVEVCDEFAFDASSESYDYYIDTKGDILRRMERFEEEHAVRLEGLEWADARYGPGDARGYVELQNVADSYVTLRRAEDLRAFLEQRVDLYAERHGEDSVEVLRLLARAAACYDDLLRDEWAHEAGARAVALLEARGGGPRKLVVDLYLVFAQSLNQLGDKEASLVYAQKVIDLFPEDAVDIDLAAALNDKGRNLRALGRYEEARQVYARAMKVVEALQGEEGRDYAALLANLSDTYEDQGEYERALEICARAIRISERVGSGESVHASHLYSRHGDLLRQLGRTEEALLFLRKAYEIQLRAFGARDPALGSVLSSLAKVLRESGEWEEALDLYGARIDILRKHEPGSKNLADTLNRAGLCLYSGRDFAGAADCFDEALTLREKLQDPDGGYTANNLGNALRELDRQEDALAAADRGLAFDLTASAVLVADRAKLHSLRAKALRELDRFDEALADAREALRLLREINDEEEIPWAWNLIGAVHAGREEYDEAVAAYEEGIRLLEQQGVSLADSDAIHENYAIALNKSRDYAGSERVYRRLLAGYEADQGSESRRVAEMCNRVAISLDLQTRYDEAFAFYERSLEILEKRAASDKLLGSVRSNFACCLRDAGEFARAHEMYAWAIEFYEQSSAHDALDVAEVLSEEAVCYEREARYDKALELYDFVIETVARELGPDDEEVAQVLLLKGEALVSLGRYSAAREVVQRALDMRVAKYGEGDVETADPLDRLGLCESWMGDDARALELAGRALEIRLRELGNDHPLTASSFNNVANYSAARGDYVGAVENYDRALGIQRALYGADSPKTATTLGNLGTSYLELGRLADARAALEHSLALREEVYGVDHPEVAWVLNKLGAVLVEQAEMQAAEDAFVRARRIVEKVLGGEHPRTADVLESLGEFYRKTGRAEEASALLERSLDIREASFGPDHPRIARSLRTLPLLLQEQGRSEEARSMIERSLEISEKQGAETPAVASSLFGLATLLLEDGRVLVAMRHAQRALDIRLKLVGEQHADTARSRHLFGRILTAGGESAGARDELTLALEVLEKALGPYHPDTCACRLSLAAVLEEVGEETLAIGQVDAAATGFERTLGPRHPRAIEARGRQAALLHRDGQLAEAADVLRAVVTAQEDVLPADHEDLQASRATLADLLEEQGLEDAAAEVRAKIVTAVVYPPIVTVLTPSTSPATTDKRSVELDAVISDYTGIRDVRIEHAGEVISASSVLGALQADESGQRARLRIPLQIPEGKDETQAVLRAVNLRGVESEPEELVIRYEPSERNLFVLAIGVGDYDDDELDLRCPVRDVDDLIALLATQEGGFYDRVLVERLTDADVTAGAVKRLRSRFLKQAQPSDTIVVFVAGHGVRTEDNDYYFMTSDCAQDDPYGGIDRHTLESLVMWNKLQARRRLLLIDTCQAGASTEESLRGDVRGIGMYKQEEVNDAVDATSGGLYIIAASADDEFARERDGNGLFTRAILDGLGGEADADDDGFVTIEELKGYAVRRVQEDSDGQQVPRAPTVRAGDDFAVFRVGS